MALGRIVTFTSGTVASASDVNGEFNNILNNANQLISPFTANVNVNSKQLTNVRVENLSSTPAAGNAGRLFFDLGTLQFKVDNGTVNYSAVNQPRQRVTGMGGSVSTGTSLVTVNANSYIFQTTDRLAAFETVSTGNITCFVASSDGGPGKGSGGRDVATTFTVGPVHLYALSTGILSTAPALIASLTAPPGFPTMSTSQAYVAACYVGSLMFTANNDFVTGFFAGNTFYYNKMQFLTSLQSALIADAVTASSAVPSNAVSFAVQHKLTITGTSPSGAQTLVNNIYYQASTSDTMVNLGNPTPSTIMTIPMHTSDFTAQAHLTIPVRTAVPKYFVETCLSGTEPYKYDVNVMSYKVANGDV